MGFRVKGVRGGEGDAVELRRVNVLTGCNGTFKTSILEALTASMLVLTSPDRVQPLSIIAATLRMDEFWLYKLLGDGFKLEIDGMEVRTAGIEELGRIKSQSPLPPSPFTRIAMVEKGGEAKGFLRVDATPAGMPLQQVPYFATVSRVDDANYDFIALSTPNPLTQQFTDSLMKLVDYARAIRLFNAAFEGLEASFMGLKPDEFGRHDVVFVTRDGERPIQYLGSGYLSLALMALAASNGIVIYDNVELHMHPWLMEKAAKLIGGTGDVQWIITTQSGEMLSSILEAADLDDVLVIESSRNRLLRTYDGEEARRRIEELNEDLRGNCVW
ncbi:hypothetical protein GCM10007981_03490 [Thermocladium modestius]|uniref:ATPase AAA-type core domain-containing protein n=1 Tax=Thermocladium modestius TaxID=62609 RepID=A0A830GU27_9CREN|nr:hypothetical protein GCM10007981_03490 [Thermocladium modestius]